MESIRVASINDADKILEIYSPFCLPSSAVSFEIRPPTFDDMRSRIATTLETYPWLVCERDDLVVGYAYASQHKIRAAYDWSVDVSVYLGEGARGQGVGTKLYLRLFDVLRKLGYFNAYAGVTIPNDASIALHKSLGFVELARYPHVGYKGAWRDTVWLGLQLQPLIAEPPSPHKFCDLEGSALLS